MEWAEFVRVYGPTVYRTAWRILGHAHDCEDVVQEVFIEAHRLFERDEVQHWATFLRRLTTFRAIDSLRRRKSTVPLADEIAAPGATPEQELLATEIIDRIREIIASLPERQAVVFCMIHFDELNHQQVADLLGISVNAVSLALHQARLSLRGQLDRSTGGTRS